MYSVTSYNVEGSSVSPAPVADETAPTISSIVITSDPGDDDAYGVGDSIDVTVTFSEDVTVTGVPQLELDFDGTAKTAAYSSANGAEVVFSYTVAPQRFRQRRRRHRRQQAELERRRHTG